MRCCGTMQRRGIALYAGTHAPIVAASAAACERLAYDSFWLNHPGSTDGVGGLAAAAHATATIDLGVGVVPLHLRDAASVVAGVRAAALPTERLLVGVGSAHRGAFRRARDGVALIREQLGCRVVLGALAEGACRLAGAIADGVLFNWLTPEHARQSAVWVQEGADAAGRGRPALYAYVRAAIGPGARARVEEAGAAYAAGSYGPHFARVGATPLEMSLAADDPAALAAPLEAWEGSVDELVLRLLPATDSEQAHLELISAFAPNARVAAVGRPPMT
jgi:alkanesulfonate monooxygenase SsuD/methylene tetrahydromethanopterin reductase-like flavin-dependent oxidoreductase (luciferase family)